MLSLFPELLFLAPLSAFIIRMAASITLGYIATRRLNAPSMIRLLGIFEGVAAALLFLGLYTQGAALLGFVLALTQVLTPRFRIIPLSTALLLVVLCSSLLVTGPGPFTVTIGDVVLPVSFDLPL